MSDLLDSPYQREAQVRIAGVLIRNAVALQDIGALSPGYGTKAEAVAREILLNCYPDEDTHDPNTAALIRQVKREGERARQLEATNAALWRYVRAQRAVDQGITDFTLHHAQVVELREASKALDGLAIDHGIPLPGEGVSS